MRIITNNTPLRYLVFLGYETILPDLFTHLIVPPAVVKGLQHAKTPARVRIWMASPPPVQFQGLADVPPEIEWFANLTNANTRRAYQQDITDFMAFAGLRRFRYAV